MGIEGEEQLFSGVPAGASACSINIESVLQQYLSFESQTRLWSLVSSCLFRIRIEGIEWKEVSHPNPSLRRSHPTHCVLHAGLCRQSAPPPLCLCLLFLLNRLDHLFDLC